MTTAAPPYRDPGLSTSARVSDLVARMTPDEKIAQLSAVWAFEVMGEGSPDLERLRKLAGHGLGEITRLAGSTNLRPIEVARAANTIQRFLVEETRLGIPAIIHEESLHGLLALEAACFQQSIGAGATSTPTSSAGWPPRSVGGCLRPGRAMPWDRSSTSLATRAGAGSRRPTARTRTSLRSSAPPTSAPSRAPTSATACWRRASTSSVTAWPKAASTRRRRTSARARCRTSSSSRSRPRWSMRDWRA